MQLLSNYIQIKLAAIQNSHTRIDLSLDDANFKITKVQYNVKSKPSVLSSVDATSVNARSRSSRLAGLNEYEADRKKMETVDNELMAGCS
jgi:hypothetical protein